jgi:hypothetical protein
MRLPFRPGIDLRPGALCVAGKIDLNWRRAVSRAQRVSEIGQDFEIFLKPEPVGVDELVAVGIAGFDDFDLTLVEYLLKGRSDIQMADIVREIYPPEKSEQLLPTLGGRTAAIKNSTVFSPLLND